jgi:hypothetical protein
MSDKHNFTQPPPASLNAPEDLNTLEKTNGVNDRVMPDGTNAGSLHQVERPDRCPEYHTGIWRVVQCYDGIDVIECSDCGAQRTVPCNFEEDIA